MTGAAPRWYTRLSSEREGRTTERGKRLFERWKTDYDFRTLVNGAFSAAVTAAFAVYNGFLGVHHASLWHGTICVYYLILLVLRGAAVLLAGRASLRGDAEETGRVKYLVLAVLLLLLNVSLIVPISLMIRQERPVGMTIIPAIAVAAYTTYKIVMASVNLKKGRASGSGFVRLLRATGFIDALVSVLTLQNTLICVVSGSGSETLRPMTIATSTAVWAAVMALAAAVVAGGVRETRGGK